MCNAAEGYVALAVAAEPQEERTSTLPLLGSLHRHARGPLPATDLDESDGTVVGSGGKVLGADIPEIFRI